ncbi:MAG: NADH-quinone oxidoreductase subunit N [Myxococcales bacterium]|nr:NADH-quinone oxidoreductase subunit N [Myxococcales bacterium]
MHWFFIAPLLCVLLGAFTVMLADAFSDEHADHAFVASGVLFLTLALSASLFFLHAQSPVPGLFSRYLSSDYSALFFDIVIVSGALLSTLLAGGYLKEHGLERGEFYVLLLLSTFGAMILARATDLLSIFIGLETMSLGVYCLVAYRHASPRATEASLKYFLLGSFSAAIFLFGSALLYGATGVTGLAEIGKSIASGSPDLRLVIVAMLLLLTGMAFKVSAVPFHMWTPDAYEGAVTPISTYMSIVVKAAAFALLIRVMLGLFADPVNTNMSSGWPPLLGVLAGLTMIVGNLCAVVQQSVKRMLAYSSISHAGFILLGVACAPEGGKYALASVFFYLLAYTVSNALAFGSLILMGSRGKEAVSYEDLAGIGIRRPLAALPLTLGMLSLMGMPPTAGFFAKYYVLSSAVDAGGLMLWVAIVGVVTSAIGAYYYLRVLVYAYMRQPEVNAPIAVPMRSGYVVVGLSLASIFVIKMGLMPAGYIAWVLRAAAQMY